MIVELEFKYHCGQSWPMLRFGHPVIETKEIPISDYEKQVFYKLDVIESALEFYNTNKKESDTVVHDGNIVRDQVIVLQNVWVDDILLDTNILKSCTCFEPEYHAGYLEYCRQHNISIEATLATFDFYFNGRFKWTFELPFWTWYHRLRLQQDRGNLAQEQIKLYVGDSADNQRLLLKNLKDLLNSV